ncbi:CheR family methyltransferase [Chitinimonas sp. BJB300]|uniref:CheR family methyltransferase n=1 Tax=Chitinimonas sp. BJB300 TaxID=1559339 RepID=UPI000C0FAD4F|nr:CheR family methyltransferase [Chitinimonas sp. BJB300]PHV12854.1 chemotaxis protein CheR [Chitinimonas sp. BJB300]TSJ86114.1 chemotaxis protein CheR [Chitinimonas sp. BJB300]
MQITDRRQSPNRIIPLPQALPALVERIATVLGLDFSEDRLPRLVAALEQARRDGLTIPTLSLMDKSGTQLSPLLPYLVVGETYFQRDLTPQGAIGQTLLQPLLQQRKQAGDLRLRCWNTACCTGEEAYTLLLCLDVLLGTDLANWQLDLLATDINPNFIAHAKTGRYNEYAFRQSDPAWRAQYFIPDGQRWKLAQAWRDRICFATHNLADPDYRLADGGNYDLILCRNVLMYLTPAAVQHILRQLQSRLTPNGYLLLSAAEAGLANNAGFVGELLGLSYAIRSTDFPGHKLPFSYQTDTHCPPSTSPVKTASRHHLQHHQQRPTPKRLRVEPTHIQDSTSAFERCLQRGKQLADQGQLAEAEASCLQALQLNPLAIAPYWLLALVNDAAGQYPLALQRLKKLSYLEPDFVLAPYLEAQICSRLGQVSQAIRARTRCLQILESMGDRQEIPYGDGLSAAQLRQLCLALEVPDQ